MTELSCVGGPADGGKPTRTIVEMVIESDPDGLFRTTSGPPHWIKGAYRLDGDVLHWVEPSRVRGPVD